MVKTTKEFIQQFKLDQENFEFNREEFLEELGMYFLEILYQSGGVTNCRFPLEALLDKSESGDFTWDMFKHCIKQVEQKFWAISNKKVGLPFSKKLWGAFYAIHVITLRASLFPEIEKKIQRKKLDIIQSKQD